jgi:hypothetical protein
MGRFLLNSSLLMPYSSHKKNFRKSRHVLSSSTHSDDRKGVALPVSEIQHQRITCSILSTGILVTHQYRLWIVLSRRVGQVCDMIIFPVSFSDRGEDRLFLQPYLTG